MEQQPPRYLTSFYRGICIPILLWMAFTPFSQGLDLRLSHFFYDNGAFSSAHFWQWLYLYGFWPAWVMTALAFAGLVLIHFRPTIASGETLHRLPTDICHWVRLNRPRHP